MAEHMEYDTLEEDGEFQMVCTCGWKTGWSSPVFWVEHELQEHIFEWS